MIPDAIIERTRDATDIVELISAYLQLKRRGQNYVGLCPFHTEKTPSFNVNPVRQIFHCFGCGKGGDAIRFLMEHERMGFVEAVRLLAERAHIEIPRSHGRSDDPADRIYRALAVAQEYFRRALDHEREGLRGRAYLEKRGIGAELIEQFQIGYAPARASGLIKYAERHDIDLRDLEAAGLIFRSGGRVGDRFTDRLVFPIRNLSGKSIAFGGRDLSGEARAKYLNSPETAVYTKGRVLYGLYEARRSIQETGEVLLCEGYFDLVRLHQHGFRNAAAVSGTALTPDQGRLLARYAQRARLLFDADSAGLQAARRSVAVLFDGGLDVWIVSLGQNEDPDSFLAAHGREALCQRLETAPGYIAFLEEWAGGAFTSLSPGRQGRILREITATVACIADPVRRDLVSQAAWSRFGISEAIFREHLAHAGSREAVRSADVPADLHVARDWRSDLLRLLIVNPVARGRAEGQLHIEDFENPLQRHVLTYILDQAYAKEDAAGLVRHATSPEIAQYVGRLASESVPEAADRLDDYLLKLRSLKLATRTRRLLDRLRTAEQGGDEALVTHLTAEYQQARREWLEVESTRRRPDGPVSPAR